MGMTSYQALCRVTEKFQWAFTTLNYKVSTRQTERWSTYILEAMSGPARIYHSAEHVLELSEGMDPLATIAALFHDIVYYQVDGGLASFILAEIHPYFEKINGILHIRTLEEGDTTFNLTLDIFGFTSGQQLLVSDGQNEFLSTLFALRLMADLLPIREQLAIAVCIEATIPFRAGTGAMKALRERVLKASEKYCLGLSHAEIDRYLRRAVRLANKDVENFSMKDPGQFLNQTWRILPEMNSRLNTPGIYSVREYRIALYKMEGFLSHLQAGTIFDNFLGEPGEVICQQMTRRAENNIRLALIYLRLKLYATAMLEALAVETGGDIPMVYFTGDKEEFLSEARKTQAFRTARRLSQPRRGRSDPPDHDPAVSRLLARSGSYGASYDSRSSPLSSYLYSHLGTNRILKGCEQARSMFSGRISSDEFLRAQEPSIVRDVAQACALLAPTRRAQLKELSARFAAELL